MIDKRDQGRTIPATTTIAELIADYELLLIDAYGVLVDASGPLPHAAALIRHLREKAKPFLIVTNDASRLPETASRFFQSFGLEIAPEQIVTAGSLLRDYFASNNLAGARCFVLGTEDSNRYVERAGGEVVTCRPDGDCDAVVVCDEDGFPFLETIDAVLSVLYRKLDRGDRVELLLPNPDLVYPDTADTFGFTSGAAAMLLEAALERRYPRRNLSFTRLGKPHPPIFAAARKRAGTDSLIMIGDQLETDIAGARGFGIDAAFLPTGITRWDDATVDEGSMPTHMLTSLAL